MVAGRCWLGRVSSPKSTCWHGSPPRTCASRASETGHAKPASSPRTGHATWHTRTSASRGDSCKTFSPPWWTWSGVTRWSSLLCPSCAAGCSLPWCGGWWLLPTATWTLAQRALQTAQSGHRAWRVSGKVRSVGWRKGGSELPAVLPMPKMQLLFYMNRCVWLRQLKSAVFSSRLRTQQAFWAWKILYCRFLWFLTGSEREGDLLLFMCLHILWVTYLACRDKSLLQEWVCVICIVTLSTAAGASPAWCEPPTAPGKGGHPTSGAWEATYQPRASGRASKRKAT